jgi:hypothetical protein
MMEGGMRKVWMTLAALGVLLLGLLVTIVLKVFTDAMWTAWCVAVAGITGTGIASNVVTKKIVEPVKGKKR